LALSLDENAEEALSVAAYVTALFIGDYETAIEFGYRAVVCNPNDARAWRLRGWTYRAAGQYEEAIRSFERGIRVSPLDPVIHNYLAGIGCALIELRRFVRVCGSEEEIQRCVVVLDYVGCGFQRRGGLRADGANGCDRKRERARLPCEWREWHGVPPCVAHSPNRLSGTQAASTKG
jgi:tetratricopeptide (TPR) repeat protein